METTCKNWGLSVSSLPLETINTITHHDQSLWQWLPPAFPGVTAWQHMVLPKQTICQIQWMAIICRGMLRAIQLNCSIAWSPDFRVGDKHLCFLALPHDWVLYFVIERTANNNLLRDLGEWIGSAIQKWIVSPQIHLSAWRSLFCQWQDELRCTNKGISAWTLADFHIKKNFKGKDIC